MNRNQQSFFTSMIIVLLTVSCQASVNPVSTPAVSPTRPAIALPSFTPSISTASAGNELLPPDQSPTPTVNAGNDLHTIFPSFSLTDPNTVCVQHYMNALSCLDATGWHVYKEGIIPSRIIHCTDGRIYLVDDQFYQYQADEDVLVGIGGWVDQGIIACGSGNEIWVSDYSKFMRFDGSTWTSYTVEDYFKSSNGYISSLAVAPNGNVWVMTNNAIATFDGVEWQVLTPPGNYSFDDSGGRSQHLVIDSSGVAWITAYTESGSDNQLLKYDGVEWSAFPGPDDNHNVMQIIAADNKNRIWVATTGTKIFTLNPDTSEWELRFDLEKLGFGNEWESRFEGEQLGLGFGDMNRINQMEFDGQGRLWVTTDYGLGIYDGVTWTIYHDYTANLYTNDISGLYILGNGPQLPALKFKPFGSIRGKLVSETQSPFTDALVKICIDTYVGGNNPCADQTESVNADGSFIISNVPAGTYSLRFKLSNEWYELTMPAPDGITCITNCTGKFTVEEGKETNLGEITVPSDANPASLPIPTQTSFPTANPACIGSSCSWSTPPDGDLSIIFTIEDCKLTSYS